MITIKHGNLLNATENIIAHQVNCLGKMGSGIALEIRKVHQIVFYTYTALCRNESYSEKLLGHCQVVNVGENKWVANLFGQYDISRSVKMTNERALLTALIYLRDKAAVHGYTIALPYGIGCGNGGGDWEYIYGLIEKVFENYQVTLYRYDT